MAGCNGKPKDNGTSGVVVDSRGRPVKPPAPRADGLTLRRPPADPDLPALSVEDARAVFRLIRSDALRKMSGRLDRKTLTEFSDLELPEGLFAQNGAYVIVGLYPTGGGEARFGFAAAGNLGFSAAGAAYAALGDADPATLKTARIKVDFASAVTPCGPDARLVPGVEGLIVANKGLALVPPDQFMADNPTMKDYLRKLVKRAGLPEGFEDKKNELMLAKFATTSVLQLADGAEPVFLYRGNAPIEPPSAGACRTAGMRGLDWLDGARQLRKDGWLPAAYYPYANSYGNERCTAAAQAVAQMVVAGYLRGRIPVDMDQLESSMVQDPRHKFTYVTDAEAGEPVSLSAAALTLLAGVRGSGSDPAKVQTLRSLADFILQQQTPDGEFLSHFDPNQGRPAKKFAEVNYPGQAILALVRLYALDGRKDARLLEAARKGAKHLVAVSRKQSAEADSRPQPAAHRPLPVDAWLMQALDALAAVEPDDGLSAHLSALADAAMAGQLTPEKTRFPDLVGAMDEADPPTVAMTAARGEGLLAALRAARRLGKADDAARIEKALDLAAGFVILNQWRPENAYALPKPERALGGFRTSVLAGAMRPETTAHAALFLLEYAQLKTGDK